MLAPEGIVTTPVKVGLASGALVFTNVVNAVAADSSAANAVAISPSVSSVPGAELIRLLICVVVLAIAAAWAAFAFVVASEAAVSMAELALAVASVAAVVIAD